MSKVTFKTRLSNAVDFISHLKEDGYFNITVGIADDGQLLIHAYTH